MTETMERRAIQVTEGTAQAELIIGPLMFSYVGGGTSSLVTQSVTGSLNWLEARSEGPFDAEAFRKNLRRADRRDVRAMADEALKANRAGKARLFPE